MNNVNSCSDFAWCFGETRQHIIRILFGCKKRLAKMRTTPLVPGGFGHLQGKRFFPPFHNCCLQRQ